MLQFGKILSWFSVINHSNSSFHQPALVFARKRNSLESMVSHCYTEIQIAHKLWHQRQLCSNNTLSTMWWLWAIMCNATTSNVCNFFHFQNRSFINWKSFTNENDERYTQQYMFVDNRIDGNAKWNWQCVLWKAICCAFFPHSNSNRLREKNRHFPNSKPAKLMKQCSVCVGNIRVQFTIVRREKIVWKLITVLVYTGKLNEFGKTGLLVENAVHEVHETNHFRHW